MKTVLKFFFYFSEGRRHDAGILTESRLLNDLQAFANSLLGNPYCIYGDPAYPLRVHFQVPFRNRALVSQMMNRAIQ